MLRRLARFREDESGVSGIEVSIVLIAFVVVATVFAFTVLSSGLLSTERVEQSISGSLKEASGSLAIRGSVIANSTSTPYNIESVLIHVTNASKAGADVNLSRSGTDSTLITYIDEDQTVNLSANDWLATWLIGSGDMISPGERAEIRVTLTGLGTQLGKSKLFSLQIKPTVGAVLHVSRTTPPELKKVMDLY